MKNSFKNRSKRFLKLKRNNHPILEHIPTLRNPSVDVFSSSPQIH